MRRLLLLAFSAALLAAPTRLYAQTPTWKIDPVHSELTFRIRHYVTRVRGTFAKWDGSITADPASLANGSVSVSIDAKSIDTNNEMRDNHLRSNDFFATDSFPALTFRSSRVELKGESLKVFGDLTIRGITRPVVLEGSYNGVTKDAQGKDRMGFEATTRINRTDYKVAWNRAIEGGGVMLGDEVEINITIEAVRQ
ncbi:MAG: YceI family protein [Gemmatimonadaceae bacterium]|nr:YceI family protein [Gemmatimonadaceae bacterium]